MARRIRNKTETLQFYRVLQVFKNGKRLSAKVSLTNTIPAWRSQTGSILFGDNSNHTLKFLPEDEFIEEHTKKPVYNKVIYEYLTPDNEYYRITYNRKGYISKQNFIDLLPSIVRILAKMIGFEGSYLRFEGEAIIERIENNEVVEKVVENSAVWELMYFGKSCADKKYREKNKLGN